MSGLCSQANGAVYARPVSENQPPRKEHRTLRLEEDERAPNPVAAAVRRRFRPALVVMSGETVGQRVTLEDSLVIGREPPSGLVLPDPGVSSMHALVEDRGGTWAVVDLGSTNGTIVEGQKVSSAELRGGDKLRFGSTIVRFEVQDEAEEAYTKVVAHLLSTDDLTGLYLRRRFDAEVATLLAAAEKAGGRLGLIAMDLDGIKGINDTHGHLFGAYTIAQAGRLIGRVLGGRGIACRFGGDEYVAALPDHDLAATFAVGEEIHRAVAAHRFEHEGVVLRPGISIGVAAYPEAPPVADPKELFRVADEALYLAKRSGKNRVCRPGG
jgi:two-component system, cell cycle response regulator